MNAVYSLNCLYLSRNNQGKKDMKIIHTALLDETTAKAKASPRLRMNYNFHDSDEACVNRLLNAIEPDSYIRPHRHLNPAKEEIFLLLRGKAVLFLFDEEGNITQQQLICPHDGVYGAEIEAGIWHSLVVLESGTVVYEIKQGPFAPLQQANLAPWSPAAENSEEVAGYLNFLKQQIVKR